MTLHSDLVATLTEHAGEKPERLADLLLPVIGRYMGIPHLVGIPEIKEMFGYSPDSQTVDQWRVRGRLPEPDFVFGRSPVWRYERIVAWGNETGREIVKHLAPKPAHA